MENPRSNICIKGEMMKQSKVLIAGIVLAALLPGCNSRSGSGKSPEPHEGIVPSGNYESGRDTGGEANPGTLFARPKIFGDFGYRETGSPPGIIITNYAGTETEIIIPGRIEEKEVVSIGNHAFYNRQLTSVAIPGSVTGISEYAFHENKLTSVTIPDSVTFIGSAAFSLNQLTSVTIGNSVRTIRGWAFRDNQLTSVVIPRSVTRIEEYAFADNQLTSITIGGNVTLGRSIAGDRSFNAAYEAAGQLAGTWTRPDAESALWNRQ